MVSKDEEIILGLRAALERANERLAKAEKRANDAWAAARMERESADYWKAKVEATPDS